MAIKTFIWSPLNGPTSDISYRTRTAQFSDGYEQTVSDGVNSEKQVWPLTFMGQWGDMAPIVAFLREHKADRSFKWVNPLNELGLYRATQLKLTPLNFESWSITVTFTTAYKV
ncbi:phage tail protein [Yersinia massiliensis]|uniref:phage tail protein n=1 Tax=Yersinia massiliensis TaxID=419257 RepID=UPI0021BD1F43|nr:phage tail protein [Yersinia massiliensis]